MPRFRVMFAAGLITGWLVMLAGLAMVIGVAALSPAPRLTPTLYAEPPGCLRPPDEYQRVWVSGVQLNMRTLMMLDHAQRLYSAQGGIIVLREALTQGSYNAGVVAASFGTHDAGGAVDISVRSPVDFAVLEAEIPLLIDALRTAGFAAWLRAEDELYPGSAIHIHAIAVGDAELSPAARAQIDGFYGYLRGYNGLPQPYGLPIADRYGGPVICQWMIDTGFGDLRGQPNPYPTPGGTTQPRPALP